MNEFAKRRIKSFSDAFHGISFAFQTEIHFKIHLIFTLLALLASWLLSVSLEEFALILVVIGLVWTAELINTAIERTVDLVTTDFHPLAKQAKDISAGAVLVTAILSVLVGLVVFLPKIILILQLR